MNDSDDVDLDAPEEKVVQRHPLPSTEGKRIDLAVTNRGDAYVTVEGVRVAVRGCPGTRWAGTWLQQEPGYLVSEVDDEVMIVCYEASKH